MAKTRVPRLTLGDRLRLAREHAHIGSTEMAQHLKCSRHTITNFERGRTTPNHATILEWARLTKYDIAWLMDGQIEMEDVAPAAPSSPNISQEALAALIAKLLMGGGSDQRSGYSLAERDLMPLIDLRDKPATVTPIREMAAAG